MDLATTNIMRLLDEDASCITPRSYKIVVQRDVQAFLLSCNTDNQTTDNQTTDNQTTDNQTTDNQTTDNQTTDNQTTDNQINIQNLTYLCVCTTYSKSLFLASPFCWVCQKKYNINVFTNSERIYVGKNKLCNKSLYYQKR